MNRKASEGLENQPITVKSLLEVDMKVILAQKTTPSLSGANVIVLKAEFSILHNTMYYRIYKNSIVFCKFADIQGAVRYYNNDRNF